MTAPYRAVVIGATGAVGGALVTSLLGSSACTAVVALGRRPAESFAAVPGRGKLQQSIIDFGDLEHTAGRLSAGCDVAFCTVGIGQPRKVAYEIFRRVDVEYAGAFARGCAAAGVRHVSLLSSAGAGPHSRGRYLRTKADAEQAVIAAGIARTSLFRPSLLVTREIRYGLQDRLTQALFPVLAPILPGRYHQITVEDLGTAMRMNAERTAAPGVEVLYYPDFLRILASA